MVTQSERFPRRFPVGTKFIIEDRRTGRAHQYARYIVLPDGRRIDLPTAAASRRRQRRR